MKITLVSLPLCYTEEPSMGLAYLTSNLKKNNHHVEKLELNLKFTDQGWFKYLNSLPIQRESKRETLNKLLHKLLTEQEFLKQKKYLPLAKYVDYCVRKIAKTNPDLVGFSVFRSNVFISLLVAKELKEKEIKVVFGGPETQYSDILPDFLNQGWLDYMVRGEGEEAINYIANSIKKGDEPEIENNNVKGIITKDNPYKKKEPVLNTKSLDSYEFPDFTEEEIKNSRNKKIPIITSRGCVNNCNFCFHKNLWPRFAQRSVENVIKEIKYQIKKTGSNKFSFCSPALNCDNTFLERLCKRIIAEKINIGWGGMITPNSFITKELFSLMYKAGCREVTIGIESGSANVLKEMNKKTSPGTASKILKNARESSLSVKAFFIVGHPKEKYEDFLETFEFIKKNIQNIDRVNVNEFYFHPLLPLAKLDLNFLPKETISERKKLVENLIQSSKYYEKNLETQDLKLKSRITKELNGDIRIKRDIPD